MIDMAQESIDRTAEPGAAPQHIRKATAVLRVRVLIGSVCRTWGTIVDRVCTLKLVTPKGTDTTCESEGYCELVVCKGIARARILIGSQRETSYQAICDGLYTDASVSSVQIAIRPALAPNKFCLHNFITDVFHQPTIRTPTNSMLGPCSSPSIDSGIEALLLPSSNLLRQRQLLQHVSIQNFALAPQSVINKTFQTYLHLTMLVLTGTGDAYNQSADPGAMELDLSRIEVLVVTTTGNEPSQHVVDFVINSTSLRNLSTLLVTAQESLKVTGEDEPCPNILVNVASMVITHGNKLEYLFVDGKVARALGLGDFIEIIQNCSALASITIPSYLDVFRRSPGTNIQHASLRSITILMETMRKPGPAHTYPSPEESLLGELSREVNLPSLEHTRINIVDVEKLVLLVNRDQLVRDVLSKWRGVYRREKRRLVVTYGDTYYFDSALVP